LENRLNEVYRFQYLPDSGAIAADPRCRAIAAARCGRTLTAGSADFRLIEVRLWPKLQF
jgi:hypothetical protein